MEYITTHPWIVGPIWYLPVTVGNLTLFMTWSNYVAPTALSRTAIVFDENAKPDNVDPQWCVSGI